MEDVNTPAAEPSPASTTEPEQPASTEPVSVPTDPEAYAEWRMSGKLPEEKKSSSEEGESAPSTKSAGEKPGKGAPASEAGNQKRQERGNAETRKEELNREIRELLAKRDSLRQEASPKKEDVKPESSTGPEGRPVKPKQENFDDWSSYEAAQDKYLEDLADWKASRKIEEHTQKQAQESLAKEMQNRLDSARERYGEESETTITGTAQTIFADDAIPRDLKTAIGRSEVIVDALYVMGSDASELVDFLKLAKTDPLEALRKWFTIEALVKEELKSGNKAPGRAPDGKFVSAETKAEKPARKEAPPPPRELNGNSAPPGDERERAAKTGDFRSFKADADRRDMQRFRGQ